MLVRWQYWYASAKMYASHPLTGVGPGNFAHFYPHYKPAEALESVADPHNFLLSILTQYGPLGLTGFLAMLFIPLWKTIPSLSIEYRESKIEHHEYRRVGLATPFHNWWAKAHPTFLIIISAVLLLVRPMIMRPALGDTFEVMFYLILTLYIAPAAAFVIGFWLLAIEPKTQSTSHETRVTYIPAALFCAVLGVITHNLIDFAIFEPPVLTTFWAVIAALIATHLTQKQQAYHGLPARDTTAILAVIQLKPAPFAKLIVLIITAAISWAYLNYCFIPPAASVTKILQANRAISSGYFEQAHNLLTTAAKDDRLDPAASNLNGRLYLQHYEDADKKQPALLGYAEQCFLEAIARDHADFKNYEKLSDVYDLLGQTQKAYDYGCKAAKRYPGSAGIQFELAQIAEKLNKTDTAIEHYKNTVDIEDSFQRQFHIMYPNRKIVSRLGENRYSRAIERTKKLSEKPNI